MTTARVLLAVGAALALSSCALVSIVSRPVFVDDPGVDDGAFVLLPHTRPLALVFTKTDGYRHDSIDAAVDAVRAAAASAFDVVVTADAGFVDALDAGGVDVVVFAHANGRLFSPAQEAALARYVRGGGGLVLLHGAIGDFDRPGTFLDDAIGARFVGHSLLPQEQTVHVRVRDTTHPLARHVPARFAVTDEVYAFADDSDVLVDADSDVVVVVDGDRVGGCAGAYDLTMPGLHPLIWSRHVGEGVVVVSALGHGDALWATPWLRAFLADALAFARR